MAKRVVPGVIDGTDPDPGEETHPMARSKSKRKIKRHRWDARFKRRKARKKAESRKG